MPYPPHAPHLPPAPHSPSPSCMLCIHSSLIAAAHIDNYIYVLNTSGLTLSLCNHLLRCPTSRLPCITSPLIEFSLLISLLQTRGWWDSVVCASLTSAPVLQAILPQKEVKQHISHPWISLLLWTWMLITRKRMTLVLLRGLIWGDTTLPKIHHQCRSTMVLAMRLHPSCQWSPHTACQFHRLMHRYL